MPQPAKGLPCAKQNLSAEAPLQKIFGEFLTLPKDPAMSHHSRPQVGQNITTVNLSAYIIGFHSERRRGKKPFFLLAESLTSHRN
jgi:hypothetical protein